MQFEDKSQHLLNKKQRCRDGVINDFLSRYRHLLVVPLLFHEVTSLHPPSFQRNDFSTCSTYFFHFGQSPNKNEMHRQQPQRRLGAG